MDEYPKFQEFVNLLAQLSKKHDIWLGVMVGRNSKGERVFDTRNCNVDSWNRGKYETRVPVDGNVDRTSAFIFSEDE